MLDPFVRFATHYDKFMWKYVDYKGWVDYVERVFRHYRQIVHTVLDVACGTGIPSILLARRGYRVVGVDRSPEMLAVLESNRGDLPISTVRSDIRDFALPEPADAAISLYDSINYLLVEEDLVRCFTSVRRALKPGALFVFDMNTLYGLAEYWGTRSTPREVGGIYSIWQNQWDPDTRVSTLHLTFWETERDRELEQRMTHEEARQTGGRAHRFEEIHQERAYTEDEVRRALRAAGFEKVDIYQHGSFSPPGPMTTRMMVVARAPAAPVR
jgi:SAM-dependent methyltransferase